MKKIVIIIVNYNGTNNILECLKSCFQLTINNQQLTITVVDNNSTDGSVMMIRKRFPQTKIIVNQENLGFAKGNNIGIRWGLKENFDYFLLLNNDTLVDKNFLIHLISAIGGSSSGKKVDKKIGIVSPKIYFAPGCEFHKNKYKKNELGKVIWYAGGVIDWNNLLASHRGIDEIDKDQYENGVETDFATGCCMLIKREVFEKLGLFDKKYFLYWEDVDFCERAKKSGYKIYYAPKAIVWHKNAGSSSSGSALHDYYLTRNRLIFGIKYASFKTKIALIKESLFLLINGRKGQKEGIRDFYLCHFGKK